MRKIQDRITLGITAGLLANMIKQSLSYILKKTGLVEITAPDKAGAMFVSKKTTQKPHGTLVGIIADFCIACELGIALTYYISATGKDNYLLKGLSMGSMCWAAMYGLLSRLGGTGFNLIKPRDSISGFITHGVFGLAAAKLIVSLGEGSLFKPHYQTLSNPENDSRRVARDDMQYRDEEVLTY
ncbi:MAG: hypothetical protein ACOWWO_06200 [Peptococcaceae bacterium]